MIHVDEVTQVPLGCAAVFAQPAAQGGGWDCYETWAEVPDALKSTSLQVRQAVVEELIKARRDLLWETGGYKVNVGGVDYWFHSDPVSQTQQLALARKADRIEWAGGDLTAQFTGNSSMWKTMSGSFVPMTGTLAQAIADAAEVQEGAIFRAAEVHIANMRAAAVPEDYDFSSGWPEVFQA